MDDIEIKLSTYEDKNIHVGMYITSQPNFWVEIYHMNDEKNPIYTFELCEIEHLEFLRDGLNKVISQYRDKEEYEWGVRCCNCKNWTENMFEKNIGICNTYNEIHGWASICDKFEDIRPPFSAQ